MAKQSLPAGCIGWAVAGIFAVVLIGKCAGDPDTTLPVTTDSAGDPVETLIVTETRFVQPESANCRADPNTSASAVESVSRNTSVGIFKTERGWSLLDRSPPCWVRSDLLAETRFYQPAKIQPLYDSSGSGTSRSSSRRAASGNSYFRNCSAARAAGAAPVHRGDPGYARRLDRDGDGVGCE